jgi:hypothetical protein
VKIAFPPRRTRRNSGLTPLTPQHPSRKKLLNSLPPRRPVAAALAKKIIAGVQSGNESDNVSDAHAHAAIALATEALSKRIVAAVDEMSNPSAGAPKATKQLAAKMAKIIVEAAASKDNAPPAAFRTFSFTNQHGEEYQLTVDAAGRSGILAGDETDWQNLHIKSDALQDDFMFNTEELKWLRSSWKAATGRELKHPTLTAEEQLVCGTTLPSVYYCNIWSGAGGCCPQDGRRHR